MLKVTGLLEGHTCERSISSLSGELGSSVGSEAYKVKEKIGTLKSERARAVVLNPLCL